jgi:hypothetical protein
MEAIYTDTDTDSAIDEIDRFFFDYQEKWHVFLELLYELEDGNLFINELAKDWGVEIPKPYISMSHIDLMPKFKWDTNGKRGEMCDTYQELVEKISKWNHKIITLKSFIYEMKIRCIIQLLVID